MTNDASNQVSPTFAQAIANAAEAAVLPKPERMKNHRKNLQAIAFHEGVAGAEIYKAEYPEAKPIRVKVNSLAYMPKPKGYDDFLTGLADVWLSSRMALASTNSADVQRLNEKFGTSFPPGKHFSEPLSMGRRKKIKAVFTRHRAPFELKLVKTMSGVRAAAKAIGIQLNAERRLGRAGVISGDTLVINGQSFSITHNGNRECIRVPINGERQRVYLEQIEWLAGVLGDCRPDPLEDTTMVHSMRELAYPVPTPEVTGPEGREISDSPYAENRACSGEEYTSSRLLELVEASGLDILGMSDAEIAEFRRQHFTT